MIGDQSLSLSQIIVRGERLNFHFDSLSIDLTSFERTIVWVLRVRVCVHTYTERGREREVHFGTNLIGLVYL